MNIKQLSAAFLGLALLAGCAKENVESADVKPAIAFSEATMTVEAAACDKTVNFTANCDWTASVDQSWVKVAPEKGNRSTTALTLSFEENTVAETPRTVTLTLTGAAASATLEITQSAPRGPVAPGTEILNADDFKTFLSVAPSFTASDETKVLADVDMGGAVIEPVSSYAGTFDGGGHKIYNFKVKSKVANSGIFLMNTGVIKNVTFGSKDGTKWDGTSEVGYDDAIKMTSHIGGVVANNAGTLDGVKNFATVKTPLGTDALTGIGGLVGMTETASIITNCQNGADIAASGTIGGETYFGGIIAYCNNKEVVVSDCVNLADLTISVKAAKVIMLGGIIGRVNLGGQILNCRNKGAISYLQMEAPSTYMMISGIAGSAYTGSCVKGCVNDGDVCSTLQQVVRNGGIVGTLNSGGEVSGNTNNGKVSTVQTEANGNWQAVGGIVGFEEKGGTDNPNLILNNVNNATVGYVGNNTTTHANKVAAGGIIGTFCSVVTVSGNTNNGGVMVTNTGSVESYAGGIEGWYLKGAGFTSNGNVNTADVVVTGSAGAAGGVIGNSSIAGSVSSGEKSTGTVVGPATGAVAGRNAATIKDCVVGGSIGGTGISEANCNALAQGAGSTGTVSGITCEASGPVATTGIKTAADLEAFAVAAASASPDFSQWTENGEVNILADIDATSLSCFPIAILPKGVTLNGNGKTVKLAISLDSDYVAMFANVQGCIKNLKTSGSVESKYSGSVGDGYLAAIAAKAENGATFLNCSNSATVTFNSESGKIAYIGGMIGNIFASAGYNVSLVNCVNSGKVTVNHNTTANVWQYVGGVLGKLGKSAAEDGFTLYMEGCKNTADVIINKAPKIRSGGVFGSCGVTTYEITGCQFDGNFVINDFAAVDRLVGGVGPGFSEAAATGTISNCVFNGTISVSETGGNYYFGGIYGNNGAGTVVIDGCSTTSSSKISAVTPKSVGMIAGRPNPANFTVKNCNVCGTVNKGEGDIIISATTGEDWMLYGSGTSAAVSISGNTFGK